MTYVRNNQVITLLGVDANTMENGDVVSFSEIFVP